MILKILPNSFQQFKLNYTMNKLMMSLLDLVRELLMAEGILKDPTSIHMTIKGSSISFNKEKRNNFKNTKQGKSKIGKEKSKEKDKCFICGKKNH